MVDQFENLLQKLVLKHPRYDVVDIVRKLYGPDRVESYSKLFYRKLNPNDRNASFKPKEFIRLIEILNEGLSFEERAVKGGDALLHHLCARNGLVAVATPETENKPERAVIGAIKSQGEMISALTGVTDGNPLDSSSAATMILDRIYEVQASLANVKNLVMKSGKVGH
jgi:hypothetical protein